MSETILIKSILHCSKCGRDNLNVGMLAEGELVMACPNCDIIVMIVHKWPNSELVSNPDGSCIRCGQHHNDRDNDLCDCNSCEHNISERELN